MADDRRALNPIVAALTILGLGTVLTLVAGLIVGFAIDDVAKGVGQVGIWGMVLTAVVAAGVVVRAEMVGGSGGAEQVD